MDRALRCAVHLSLASTVSYLCTDIDYVVELVVSNQLEAVILDESYLLVYSVGSPWYSKEVLVVEEMVLRINPGSSFTVVTDFLDDLAEAYDAKAVVVGGALARSSKAIRRLYERAGFKLEDYPQLTKRRS